MNHSKRNEKIHIFGVDRRVIALGFARMADAMGNSFLIVVLPLYIASGNITGSFLGFSESLITGIVLGLFGLVSSLCQPFSGLISDRMGKRRFFVLLGLIAFMFTNLLYIVAHSYTALLLIRTLQGIAAALTITASIALVSEVSKRESRGSNMGVYNSFRLLGFGAGPLASGILVEAGPYTLPFIGEINGFVAAFCIAGLAAFISTLLVLWLVDDPEETKPSNEKMVIRFTSEKPGRILDPIFALGLATFIMSVGFSLLASIEPAVNQRLSQGPFMFALEFSALIGMLAIMQPVIGKLSDIYGRKIFIVTGLVLLGPITFAEGLVTAPWQMILARALQGICAASVFAPALALAGDLAKKGQVGAQLSVLTVAFGIGISFGTIISGYTIRFGFIAPFSIGAILAVIGAILVQTQVPKDRAFT